MERSRVGNVDLPHLLGYVKGVVEDRPFNAHIVVDKVVAKYC